MAHPTKAALPHLENLKSVHIIGVCGTLMGAFAAFLKRRGIAVTGSDQNVYPPMSDVLTKAGIQLYSGYRAENLNASGAKPDLVVIGNVINAQNPEARAAIDEGYCYSSLPEAMEKLLLQNTRNLCVSGTHGKTTTSSLLAHVLVTAGRDPNYFIGGVAHDLPFSFNVPNVGKGHPFILEGDEYDTAFWDKVPKFNHYLPDDAILTSVEYDHADIYPDFAAVVRAFEGLITRIRPGGKLIACFEYPAIKDLAAQAAKLGTQVITYGSAPAAGIRFAPARVRVENEKTRFDVMEGDRKVDEVTTLMSGNHNVLNALAVWIECRELGLNPEQIHTGLSTFQGVKRRQEIRGEARGVMVMDDFAHHPTAVRETLKGLRSKYPDRRIVAVFEPRSATSRRKVFQKDYAIAFDEADATFIMVPFDQSKISSDDQFSSDQLVDDISGRGKSGHLMNTVEEGVAQVAAFAKSGDLVAVLSNGGFGGFIPKLLDAIKQG
ncbi:MAG: UDP-N-acetylmuramate dehydrogenase [Methylotenera sp.]|nr:UDP-N-acetylmuramate dehydrogenase [Oligoflexia bacterium]